MLHNAFWGIQISTDHLYESDQLVKVKGGVKCQEKKSYITLELPQTALSSLFNLNGARCLRLTSCVFSSGCCIMEKGGRAQLIIGRQHHHRLMPFKVEVTPSSDNTGVTFDKESGSKSTALRPRDSVSASNLATDITAVTARPNGDALTNNISGHPDIAVVKPVTTPRQRVAPFVSSGPKLLPYPVNVAVTQSASGRFDRNLLRPASSHSSLTSCTSSTSVHSDLCSPGYLMAKSAVIDVPAHHQGVLNVIETWIDVCCIDFEFNSMMKKEVKDFFKKMSTLGPEYDTWSQKMQRRLNLEVFIIL